jgi:iron complex outermembrane receptor protein
MTVRHFVFFSTVLATIPSHLLANEPYSPVNTYYDFIKKKGSKSTPRFKQGESIRGKFNPIYNSNSKQLLSDITLGNTQGFVRGIIKHLNVDNYKDGDGNEIHSAFTHQKGSLIFGYTPTKKTRFELSLEAAETDDAALYAHACMDLPQNDKNTIRFKFQNELGTKAMFYYSEVDRVMDNYSLRSLISPMKMVMRGHFNMQGGRITQNWLTANKIKWTLGIDHKSYNKDTNRFAGSPNVAIPTNLQSIMLPDVDLQQTMLFGEVLMPSLKAALRYRHVSTQANRTAQTAMGGITPNDLYLKYYGTTAQDHEENHIDGFINYKYKLTNGFAFIDLSRAVRTATAMERFIAVSGMNPVRNGIGNPNLNPEQTHQVKLGISWKSKGWQQKASIFYNDVTDYILRDRAHAIDNSNIYRNIDARLYGFELKSNLKWNFTWSNYLNLTYIHATNITDDRPIAQTPPLMGTLGLHYKYSKNWYIATELEFAAKQTRVDNNINTGSGLDIEETSGFSILNIFSGININKQMNLQIGINNLFDKTYAYHVNPANIVYFNPEAIQVVNEPGRIFWLNLTATF